MRHPASDIFWLSLSRVLSMLLLAVAYFSLFRYLGPENAGRYQYIISFTMLFGVVVDFGMTQYVIKKMTEAPQESKTFFSRYFTVLFPYDILLYLVIITIAYFTIPENLLFKGIIVYAFGVCLSGLAFPYLCLMTAQNRLKDVSVVNFVASVANSLVIFVCIFLGKGILFLAISSIVSSVLVLISYFLFTEKFPRFRLRSSGSVLRDFLIHSWPFVLLTVTATLYNRIDTLLISKILGFKEAGLYSAAYKYLDLANFFPAVVGHATYPIISGMASAQRINELRNFILRYQRLLIALAVFISALVSSCSRYIITILAGPEYIAAAGTLSILVWASGLLIIYTLFNGLVISSLTKQALLVTVFSLAVNIIGNIILLPRFGIQASAYLTVACELIQLTGYNLVIKKRFGTVGWLRLLGLPFFATIASTLVIFLLQMFATPFVLQDSVFIVIGKLVFIGVVSLSVYLSILFSSGYLKLSDLKKLHEK